MKNLIQIFIIVFLFLFPVICDAKGLTVICGIGVTAAGCDPGIGNNNVETSNQEMVENQMWCWSFTSSCGGTLGYGYVNHHGASEDNVKICVFNDDGVGAEPEDATQVGNCSIITSSTDESKQSNEKLTGSVTGSTDYWICLVTDATVFNLHWDTSTLNTLYYNGITGSYTTPTTNAGDTWSTIASRNPAAYVVIE